MRELLYQRIERHLLTMIEKGELKPGDRVPTERELHTFFGVSRMTARQALIELERAGIIARYQGRGSFVAEPKFEWALADLTSFTDDLSRRGFRPGSVLLRFERIEPAEAVARALSFEPGTRVLLIERLRLANGAPVVLQDAYLQSNLNVDRSELEAGSLYTALRQRGIVPSAARETLEALLAVGADAERLGVREGAPLLGLTRLTYDQHGHPIEFTYSKFRGDRYRFVVDFARNDVGPRHISEHHGAATPAASVRELTEQHGQWENPLEENCLRPGGVGTRGTDRERGSPIASPLR